MSSNLQRSTAITPRTDRTLLSFGGVAFEVLAEPRLGFHVPESASQHCLPGRDPRVGADALCSVRSCTALPGQAWHRDEVRFWRTHDAGEAHALLVRGHSIEARVEALHPGRYAVSAAITPSQAGYLALLLGVSAAIAHLQGGILLHAAAIELDGQALLFVGPSGAGKSTAVTLADAGRYFAHDRVAVLRDGGRWFAWGLPGGTPVRAARASAFVYPLAAVLRVRQGLPNAMPLANELRGAPALFAVRESVEWADDSPGAEEVYLRAAMELSSQVRVLSLTTVLGLSLTPTLRALLSTTDRHEQELWRTEA